MQATNFISGNTTRIMMMTVTAFTNLVLIMPFGFRLMASFYRTAFGQFFGQADTSIR
jgi:tRNA(Leu) C34 or U34 (ribose-2'-O)-methylase TrmL